MRMRVPILIVIVAACIAAGWVVASTEASQQSPHPIIGLWRVTYAGDGGDVSGSVFLFSADGTMIEQEPDGGVAVGLWEAFDPSSVQFVQAFSDSTGASPSIGLTSATVSNAGDSWSLEGPVDGMPGLRVERITVADSVGEPTLDLTEISGA